MPCPGIFDWPAPSIVATRCRIRGDIGQLACSTGLASRTADGNPTGVARPSRHWATGDCTRCKKPDRPGLRQSSGAPWLPAFTAPKRRVIVASCLPSCDARFVESRRCNEVRLLSRRIIIRLFDDVKKKVQKNLRARSNRSTSRARFDDDTIDTFSDDDSHASIEVPKRVSFDRDRRRRTLSRAVRAHVAHAPSDDRSGTASHPLATTIRIPARCLESRMNSGFPACVRSRARCAAASLRVAAARASIGAPTCPTRFRIDHRSARARCHRASRRLTARASTRQLREYDERVMRARNGRSLRHVFASAFGHRWHAQRCVDARAARTGSPVDPPRASHASSTVSCDDIRVLTNASADARADMPTTSGGAATPPQRHRFSRLEECLGSAPRGRVAAGQNPRQAPAGGRCAPPLRYALVRTQTDVGRCGVRAAPVDWRRAAKTPTGGHRCSTGPCNHPGRVRISCSPCTACTSDLQRRPPPYSRHHPRRDLANPPSWKH